MAIPNIHQSIDEILKSSSPEQRVLWQQLRLLTGENAAIRQLFYIGNIAGTEFLTYSVNKLYIAYELEFSFPSVNASQSLIELYDEANAVQFTLTDSIVYWDATAAAARFYAISNVWKNHYFSRITNSVYNRMKFNGFRISF